MKRLSLVLILVFFISCKKETPKSPLDNLADLDVKLSVPKPGEWLAEHNESGQSFEKYTQIDPVTISEKRKVIYIQPIGNFTSEEKKIVDKTVEYVGKFFQLKTTMLSLIPEDAIPSDKKRMNSGVEQFDASYITHKVLPKKMPDDGIVVMAITAKDLYPSEDWNYVFGLASYQKRTGVSSFNRFLTDNDYTLCLNRITKTAVHEIGHMFTINHCKHAVCLMNGVNHLPESDTKPNALCSECLKKLSWNLKYDDKKRFNELISFLNSNHLEKDALLLQRQLEALE